MTTYVQAALTITVWGDGSSLSMTISLDSYLRAIAVQSQDVVSGGATPFHPTQEMVVLGASGTNVSGATINGTLVTVTWSAAITGANSISLVLGV